MEEDGKAITFSWFNVDVYASVRSAVGIMNAVVEARHFHKLTRLPALPDALHDLLRKLDDENADQRQIVMTISRDLSLSCKMLRIANSSFYGLAYHVASVHDALMILGLQTVRSLAVSTLLTSEMQKWAGSLACLRHFFEHALETAIYCQLLAKHISIQSDVAFTTGLLHDVGKLALVVEFPASSEVVFESEDAIQDLRAYGGESMASFSHAQLGRDILEHWHFPLEMQEAVLFHHAPPTEQSSELTLLVIAANILNHPTWSDSEKQGRLQAETLLWRRLDLDEAALALIQTKAHQGFQEIVGILHQFGDGAEGI